MDQRILVIVENDRIASRVVGQSMLLEHARSRCQIVQCSKMVLQIPHRSDKFPVPTGAALVVEQRSEELGRVAKLFSILANLVTMLVVGLGKRLSRASLERSSLISISDGKAGSILIGCSSTLEVLS